MNKYELRMNNAIIPCEGLNEWSAMKNLCLFEIGELVDCVRWCPTGKDALRDGVPPFGWIYQVVLNGKLTLAYIKRIG